MLAPLNANSAQSHQDDDSDLVKLGKAFDAAARRILEEYTRPDDQYDQEAIDRLEEELCPIEKAITAIPANSIAGMMVKARLVYWFMNGDVGNDDKYPSELALNSLLRDLLEPQGLVAVPDRGFETTYDLQRAYSAVAA